MGKDFVILTLARTGSSSLAKALRIHPEIKLLAEPFHEPTLRKKKTWYINQVHNMDSFISTLNTIYCKHNGIKHSLEHIPVQYNMYMANSGIYKIIYLYRKNILKNVISSFISKQTQEWGTQKNKILEHIFKPLSLKEVSKMIHMRKEIFKKYRLYLESNDIPYFDLCYEELYGKHIKIDKRMNTYFDILKFLGFCKDLNEEQLNSIREILSPSTKLNSTETYKLIPNIHKIEKEFGCRENGYLFE